MSKSATVQITSLSDKGEGIAKVGDLEIYIQDALIGERGTVTYDKPFVKGSKRYGALSFELADPSPDRIEPFCPHFKQCGGCTLQHLKYDAQLKFKQQCLSEALRSCGIDDAPVQVTGFEHLPCRYKSIRAFTQDGGRIGCGFYRSRSHEVLKVENCPLEPQWFCPFLQKLCALLTLHGVTIYDEESLKGNLRHVMLRDGGITGDRLCVLIGALQIETKLKEELAALGHKHKVNFYCCLNASTGNQILSPDLEKLHEEGPFTVSFLNKVYEVSPLSFVQVNYEAASHLYQRAADFCAKVKSHYPEALKGQNFEDCALDLCCGMGTMTLALAQRFSRVYGVEIVKEAVQMAALNARRNNLDNASFIAAPLEGALQVFNHKNITAVICDPARSGLGKRTVKALCRLKGPVHLSLIFYSLKALKRDLPPLLEAGYVLEEAEAVDMFLHSMHLEALLLLSKRPGTRIELTDRHF